MKPNEVVKTLELMRDTYNSMGYTLIFKHKIDVLNEAINCLKENEWLKESLRKCSPWENMGSYDCHECNQLIVEETYCVFCGADISELHTDDCEYVKLTEVRNEAE